jgi:transposase-like protein
VPRAYKTYTEVERLTILATAMAEGLSATAVHKRFGVKPVTYYLWRKKAGLRLSTGRRPRIQVDRPTSEHTDGEDSRSLPILDPGAS